MKALILAFLITMSPQALSAFSHITGLQITTGTIDLLENHQEITAIGIRDGVSWEVRCLWKGGVPRFIFLENPQTMI